MLSDKMDVRLDLIFNFTSSPVSVYLSRYSVPGSCLHLIRNTALMITHLALVQPWTVIFCHRRSLTNLRRLIWLWILNAQRIAWWNTKEVVILPSHKINNFQGTSFWYVHASLSTKILKCLCRWYLERKTPSLCKAGSPQFYHISVLPCILIWT